MVFHCMAISHFVYVVVSWWHSGCFYLMATMNNTAVHVSVEGHMWTYVSFLLGDALFYDDVCKVLNAMPDRSLDMTALISLPWPSWGLRMKAISCLLPSEESQAPPKCLISVGQTLRLLSLGSWQILASGSCRAWSRVLLVEGTERADNKVWESKYKFWSEKMKIGFPVLLL